MDVLELKELIHNKNAIPISEQDLIIFHDLLMQNEDVIHL